VEILENTEGTKKTTRITRKLINGKAQQNEYISSA
jgi:hypothetical protein